MTVDVHVGWDYVLTMTKASFDRLAMIVSGSAAGLAVTSAADTAFRLSLPGFAPLIGAAIAGVIGIVLYRHDSKVDAR